MINLVTECTNIYIKKYSINITIKVCVKKRIVSIEIQSLAGSYCTSKENLVDFWAVNGTIIDLFHDTMSMNRFVFLMRCFRFDDIKDRIQCKELDKLAPIRDLFTMFIHNCQNAYSISEYSTIDEK